jgi:hypothetical protein
VRWSYGHRLRLERKADVQASHPTTSRDYFAVAGNLRTGSNRLRVLLTGKEDAPDNFRADFSEGNDEGVHWTTPRHRHNFEQVRYVLTGTLSITPELALPAGMVAYFPEGVFYGPQDWDPELRMLQVQFGGPTGLGYMSVEQRARGRTELLEEGVEFVDGKAKWRDRAGKRHQQDAYEAVWEHIRSEKIAYPAPRYSSVISIDPSQFEWLQAEEGTWYKSLGVFSERHVGIGIYRARKGATIRLGQRSAAEILFLSSGTIRHDAATHAEKSAFACEAGEPVQTLIAGEEVEMFHVRLPAFGGDRLEHPVEGPQFEESMPA